MAKKPNSVAAMIRAVRPNHEHAEKIIALEAKVRRLQDELDAVDGEHERSLRALQQQHLRFKNAMEKRVKDAERGAVGGAAGAGKIGSTAEKKFSATSARQLQMKVHELAGECESLREKARRAEREVVKLRSAQEKLKRHAADATRRSVDAAKASESVAVEPASKRGKLAPAVAPSSPGKRKSPSRDPESAPPSGHPATTPFDPTNPTAGLPAVVRRVGASWDDVDVDQRASAPRSASPVKPKSSPVKSKSPESLPRWDSSPGPKPKPRRRPATAAAPAAPNGPRARRSLDVAMGKENDTAAAASFVPAEFAARLQRLEQKAVAREAYWKGVVNEVQKAHAADAATLRKQCQRAIDAKNVQIRQFREQLSALMQAMHEQALRKSIEGGVKSAA